MPDTVTKVEITELPEVLQTRINADINEGFSVLDIEKSVTISKRFEKTYVDFRAKLNRQGVFVEYRLSIYQDREVRANDIHASYITSGDILLYITKNKELFRRVSDLINVTDKS